MGAFKSLINSFSCFQAATMLLLLIALSLTMQNETAEAQSSCSTELSNLNVCAPYMVPGSTNTNPSSDCCGALQAVHPDCLCNTLRVAARLPTKCNLSPITCDANN